MKIQSLLFIGALAMAGCGTAGTDHSAHNANTANSSEHGGHSMESSPHAEHADYDLQFIDTMIVHHQAAVDMVHLCEARAVKPEIKKLCADILSSQTKEIEQMRGWRESWFPGKPPAINGQLAGMAESMKDMDMKHLDALVGEAYDREFMRQMIPHHVGAVAMSKEAQVRSSRAEIKSLADSIIKAQDAEIKQMKDWSK